MASSLEGLVGNLGLEKLIQTKKEKKNSETDSS